MLTTIDVVIPTRTDSEHSRVITQASINSLFDSKPPQVDFNVVVCEQVKDAPLFDHVKTTLHYDFTFNFNKVLNLGASHCSNKYIMFANNDLLYTWNFIGPLFVAAQGGYKSLSPTDPRNDKPTSETYVEGYGIGKELKGWCIFVDREMYEGLGGFDDRVNFWYSDDLYAEQLKKAGIVHARVTNSFVIHFEMTTIRKQTRAVKNEYMRQQKEIFEKIKKEYYG
jgi:hypothetical protein